MKLSLLKTHKVFFIFFTSVIAIFLWKVITMQGSFINADYLRQFYPWSQFYSESIKGLNFPFWCRYIGSGFPLMAEGQIGGFYPFNILIFLLLPFKIAYNYSILLHFIIAGISSYFYARRLGSDEWGGSLAALLFCFGSAYAGCFYNIVTLKTLAWFPLVLLLFEIFFNSKKKRFIILAAVVIGTQFLAGFLQMAAYAFFFYLVYMLYGFKIYRIRVKDRVIPLLILIGLPILISLPQTLLTYQLAGFSARQGASLGFALWKSFPPVCALSIVFPRWLDFLGPQLYIGILSILFLIYSLLCLKDSSRLRPLFLIGILSFLFALGRYNPLYVGLLKTIGFYSFRNPSKFLFFTLFAISILSGVGFTRFFNKQDKGRRALSLKIFSYFLACSLVIFFASRILLVRFKGIIIDSLNQYVVKHVYGKPYHRYDLEAYLEKVQGLYRLFLKGINLQDIFVIMSLALIVVGLIFAIFILKRKGNKLNILRVPVFCIIFIDIFIYSFYGTGFRGNIKPFSELKPTHEEILASIRSDRELFRILPFGILSEDMPDWAIPNTNILEGIDSIGIYTPLAQGTYKSRLGVLEVVDDSLGLLPPSDDAILQKHDLLRVLNVKYIMTPYQLRYGFLKELLEEDGMRLYLVKDYLPRAFFTESVNGVVNEIKPQHIEIIEYRSGLIKISVSTQRKGFILFSENLYPGWNAYVDGEKVDIIAAWDIIQAVEVDKEDHEVLFEFKPDISGKIR